MRLGRFNLRWPRYSEHPLLQKIRVASVVVAFVTVVPVWIWMILHQR